jgi:hypothetical protein
MDRPNLSSAAGQATPGVVRELGKNLKNLR